MVFFRQLSQQKMGVAIFSGSEGCFLSGRGHFFPWETSSSHKGFGAFAPMGGHLDRTWPFSAEQLKYFFWDFHTVFLGDVFFFFFRNLMRILGWWVQPPRSFCLFFSLQHLIFIRKKIPLVRAFLVSDVVSRSAAHVFSNSTLPKLFE